MHFSEVLKTVGNIAEEATKVCLIDVCVNDVELNLDTCNNYRYLDGVGVHSLDTHVILH